MIDHFIPFSPKSMRFSRRGKFAWAAAAVGILLTASAGAAIEHTTNGFLFTGTGYSVLLSDTNGAILSMATDGGSIAASGEAGLWSVSFTTNGSSGLTGSVNAASFAPASGDLFEWSLPSPSNVLYLTYSNADITVEVAASNHATGVDFSAAVTPRLTNVYALTLPAPLRFEADSIDRFIAPNHSSDGVGMAYNSTFFQQQDPDLPASWSQEIFGPAGYTNLYGGDLVYGSYDVTNLTFTSTGAVWLGASVTSEYSNATAVVHRPPNTGQADVVLVDSPNGAYFSGSHLGGGGGAGYLMRIGGLVDASRVDMSLDFVVGAMEHLAQSAGAGRTNLAMLSMVRGPVVGANWPSEVRLDQWMSRMSSSGAIASNGIGVVTLTTVPEIIDALTGTNYFAILNPYGELLPASLSNSVMGTVTNIGDYVEAGGHWFEVGGYPFYQELRPYLYYTNNLFYPPVFADFYQVESTNGHAAVYGVQPLPLDEPWAGATNPAALFVPGQLIWGADAQSGWLQRSFGVYAETNEMWQAPAVRLSFGRTAAEALADYADANVLTRSLTNKMTADMLGKFEGSVMIHYKGDATQLVDRIDDLPAPALLHFEEYLQAGFDKEYPDHLYPGDPPLPSTNFGTAAEFSNFLAEAHARDMLAMPYTNPSFWGVDPKGPTWDALGTDDPLLLNLDGSINYEEYFGHGGFTVTPWHPEVQAANRATRNYFLTNYPVDVLFHDQLGARTWQYDRNTNSPAPHAYIAGLAAIAGEDSQLIPLSTENGWDRLINYEAQFAGLAWGLSPTTNAPFWRRYLRERYAPSTWEVFPLAQYLSHDKLAFTYNNLDAAVHNHEVMAWTLGLGYNMTYVIEAEDLSDVDRRQWLLWIDRVQKSVAARYMGQGVSAFNHDWGTDPVNPDNGIMEAVYGPVEVTANLGTNSLTTNSWTLPGFGYLAEAPGLVAGHIIQPGESDPVAYVAETNGAGQARFWIYSGGGTNVKIVLPDGYDGTATVQVETNAPAQSEVVNDVLTVTLPASANAMLWSGTATFSQALESVYLVDFGRHDGGTNGDTTPSPDINGNYWNNIGPATQAVTNGTQVANLVNTTNGTSGLGLEITSTNWQANGILNGGLLNPTTNLLGMLGVTNATMDYFFVTATNTFKLTGLDTNRTYDLTFFGTRSNASSRISTYAVGTNTVNLETSGAGIGDGGYDGNNNTSAVLRALSPDGAGEIDITLSVNTGGFAYLGILKIEESGAAPAPPAASTQAVYRVDFGRHDGGTNGDATASPDGNGNYWNNIGPTTQAVSNGTQVADLVSTTNGSSGIDITMNSSGWNANGILNGGLLNPSPALLGDLAVTNATEDYFFTTGTDTFVISGLNTSNRYNLRFFGTRSNTSSRITTYTVGFASTNLQTSGTGIGAGGYNGNNHTTAVIRAVAPDVNGEIDVSVAVDTGGYAYLGILEIEEYIPAPATSPAPAISVSPGSLSFTTTNGGANPPAQTFGLTNSGAVALNYTVATNAGWLSVSPASGSLDPDAGQQITVSVDASGLSTGLSNALIQVSDPNATNSPQYVSVELRIKPDEPLLAVYGSSVAKGWNSSGHLADPDVFVDGGSWSNGYTALMTLLLEGQGGPGVTNVSQPGQNTAWALDNFDARVNANSPTYVLLAWSLGNEGLSGSGSEATSSNIVATFSSNLWDLVEVCRSNGFQPVISSVYPHGNYTTNHYAHLKRMHLIINEWDVPSLNLLTPIDDGYGQWVDGYWYDVAHPNDPGYAEFFYAFVPSLFDAIAAGKTNRPSFGSSSNFARLVRTPDVNDPLSFTPSNTVHSFTMAIRLRTAGTGTVAAVRSGTDWSTLEVRAGQLVYIDRAGSETPISTNLSDGAWHDVALSSRYALSNTAVYVDGVAAGSIPEQYVPDQFILGGPGASGRAPTPGLVDLQNWCVYRAGWTPDEALAQKNGDLQQSSMEIGAMLDEAVFADGSAVSNRAQSLSIAMVNTPNLIPADSGQDFPGTLLVLGSSVAKGWNGGGGDTNGSFVYGYAGRLTTAIEPMGWGVTNASIGGNDTADVLARFDTDAVPVDPDILMIGLSLANEGLVTNQVPENSLESFRSGMTNLIYRCRTNGFVPAVTLVYPNNDYNSNHYAYVKRMNLIMNEWDVPSVNLLGPVDDGTGQWADGFWSDNWHPDAAGHEQMFQAIVPTLFEAIRSGKTNSPSLAGTHGYARLQGAADAPLAFTPGHTMESFNLAFRVRSAQTGTVAAVITSTGGPPPSVTDRILVDFGRHDGGVNGTATGTSNLLQNSGFTVGADGLDFWEGYDLPSTSSIDPALFVTPTSGTAQVAGYSDGETAFFQTFDTNALASGIYSWSATVTQIDDPSAFMFVKVFTDGTTWNGDKFQQVTLSNGVMTLTYEHDASDRVQFGFSGMSASNGYSFSGPSVTAARDANGIYWNNLSPADAATNRFVANGTALANLVSTNGTATAVGLEITSGGWEANGRQNGGLFNPSNSLLGSFAIETATEDYFYTDGTETFKLTGLDTSSAYDLRFFGTRSNTQTRVTTYSAGTNSVPLQTSGTNVGTYAVNQNDDTIVELTGLIPTNGGELTVSVQLTTGSYAHLGILEIVEQPITGAQGGVIEIRTDSVAFVGINGETITAAVDADDGSWRDIALSYSEVRGLAMLYVDGVLAGTLTQSLAPQRFVLGGRSILTNHPVAPAVVDLQDWCVYRAPWTPDEALAQSTGALQQASMEIGAPLNDASFALGAAASNRAQSLSLPVVGETNLTAGMVVLPPGNLQANSPSNATVNLTWTDNSTSETGMVVQRRPSGGGWAWSNIAALAANATSHVDTGVAEGVFDYRVASQENGLLSDYSNIASATVTNPPYSDPSVSYREWASGYFNLAPEAYWIDFNTNASPDYGGQPWNTVTGLAAVTPYSLLATNGGDAGYVLMVTDDFSDFRANNGAPLGTYDSDAQSTYFGINSGGAQVVLSNLNRNARFDALVFTRKASINPAYDYRTDFTFSGGGEDVAFEVDAYSNETPVRVFGLKPDGVRTLTLDLDGPASPTGTVFGGISFLTLREISGPGPFLIDFNASSSPSYPAGETWNTITSPTSAPAQVLEDAAGSTNAGYTLTLTDAFDQDRADNGGLTAGFPDDAENTCFALRDDVPLTAQMTFGGLDTNLLYDFTFLARRGTVVGGFDYGGTYTFTGAVATAVQVESATNTAYTDVTGLAPDASGQIRLTVSAGPGAGTDFPVLNLIRLSSGGPAGPDLSGPQADPDGDLILNVGEYGLDLDPLSVDANPLILESAGAAMPTSTLVSRFDKYGLAWQADYVVETSTNLINPDWQPDGAATLTLVGESGDTQTMELERFVTEPELYFRINVDYEP